MSHAVNGTLTTSPSGTSMGASSLVASASHTRSLVGRPQMLVLATVGALT